jgi:hypothetical protein
MIRIGTFPRSHLDLTGRHPRILLTDDLARKVAGSKRLRIS